MQNLKLKPIRQEITDLKGKGTCSFNNLRRIVP